MREDEIKAKIKPYLGGILSYPIETFDKLVGTVMLHFDISYNEAASLTYTELVSGYRKNINLTAISEKQIEVVIGKITSERYLARRCTRSEADALIQAQLAHNLKEIGK